LPHSLYRNLITENLGDLAALHKEGAYTHLMNEEDFENLKWLHIFKYVCILVSTIFVWVLLELLLRIQKIEIFM